MDKQLIERINTRLKELGITERQASIEATGKPDTIRNIRRGKTNAPRIDTLTKIADVLKTTPNALLGNDAGAGALAAPPATGIAPPSTRTTCSFRLGSNATSKSAITGKNRPRINQPNQLRPFDAATRGVTTTPIKSAKIKTSMTASLHTSDTLPQLINHGKRV